MDPGNAPSSSARAGPPSSRETYGEIWRLAWPVSISASTHMLLMLANLFWIGHLGTAAVAAVSLTSHVLFMGFGLTQVVFVGAVAVVARRTGEEDLGQGFDASVHALLLGLLLGLAVGVGGWFAAEPLISFFEVDEAVSGVAIRYLQIAFAGHVFFFVWMGISASYQGTGDTRTPMVLNVVIVSLNAIIDPFLIFAPGEFFLFGIDLGWKGMGVSGAAAADVAATALGSAIFLFLWASRWGPFPIDVRSPVRIRLTGLWQIARVGIPASITMLARPMSTFLLLKVVASFGTAALAAFGIAFRAFSLNFIPFAGLNAAVSTLVGQRLGARLPSQAKFVVRRGVVVAVLTSVTLFIAYASFADPLIGIFDSSPEVLAIGVPFMLAIAGGQLFTGPAMPLAAAMNGAGDTRPPMISALFSNWVIKLPLAYSLAVVLGFGIRGVWMGMMISMVIEALLLVFWFRRGRWATATV